MIIEGGSSTSSVTQLPSAEQANIKVPLDRPSTQSGGGWSSWGLAIALLVALGMISLFAWKARSTFVEEIADPTEPGPDDPPTKPLDSSPDKNDGSNKDDPGDGFVDIEI